MDDDIAIKVDHISKNFVLPHERVTSIKSAFTGLYKRRGRNSEVQHALRDISFEIKKGEFFGIVGRNGSGKSTMLKILAGIYQPTKGKIYTSGRLVPFIELGVGFNPELTGRENVYLNGALLGFSRKEIDAMYDDIVAFSELERFMDQKLKNYSSGMQVRLAFSMATRAQADILLIDEVLAVGDADFQRKCFEYFKKLKKNKTTVVFVSHDMNAVKEFCDRAILIDENQLKYSGGVQDIAKKYALLFAGNQAENRSTENIEEERWGNQAAMITDVKSSLVGNNLVIKVKARAAKEIGGLLYGLHVIARDGSEVTAMNNRMIDAPDIKDIKLGNDISFEWKMLNVFNDGTYSVTLTLVDDLGSTVDWYVGATEFTVRRAERSTTAVFPPIAVSHKVTSA